MKTIFPCIAIALASFSVNKLNAQVQDSSVIQQISSQILLKGKAYSDLEFLCKKIGHRLSGSPQEQKTILWAQQTLKEAGADSVWLQPVNVPNWKRGKESLIVFLGKDKRQVQIPMLSLGNSEGTKGKDLKAGIVHFENLDALKQANESEVKGKIVFLDQTFPEHFPCTFDGYSQIGGNRYNGPAIASKKGAVGLIIRSLSTGDDAVPHTGVMSYGDASQKIPAIAIGNLYADSLAYWMQNSTLLYATINSNCTMQGEVLSYNIIGELKGRSNKIITVGAHHDSWDVGEGAHDDGAGVVQSIEVLRTFAALKMRPNHTIRVVLFANEENGVKGGLAYADSAVAKNEKHLFALESDAGGFSPRGFSFSMSDSLRKSTIAWQPLLYPLGILDFERDGGGVDIDPLRRKLNVPLAGLYPDPQRYFDLHHTASDVFEAVNKRELHLGAAAMAAFVYLVDKYWQ